jgi:hypothetical protein
MDEQYEKRLTEYILHSVGMIDKRFGDLAVSVAREISPYRSQIKNPAIREQIMKKVVKLLNDLGVTLYDDLMKVIRAAIDLADQKNDKLVVDSLKIAGGTIVTASVLKLLNRKFEKGAKYTLTEALKLERLDNVYREIASRKINGLTLSERVWNLSLKGNKESIELYLKAGFQEGKPANEIARELKKYLNDSERLFRRVRDEKGNLFLSRNAQSYHPGQGVYRSSFQNARRLTATEINSAYRKTDHDRWHNNPGVVGFEVKLSGNHSVKDMCNDLVGHYPKSFLFSGWHSLCRCRATPVLLTDHEHERYIDSILNDEPFNIKSKNTVEGVPEGFSSWIEKNTERIQTMKRAPFFVQDNFKNGNVVNGLNFQPKKP